MGNIIFIVSMTLSRVSGSSVAAPVTEQLHQTCTTKRLQEGDDPTHGHKKGEKRGKELFQIAVCFLSKEHPRTD